ncbi:biotin transporter BioY [Paenibacillus baekrokdamisoli]|uniref:Biotin transporter n=1 Tax=Paenibacillus baekrokdamisoli TaxID=1712516 RepID=A0A3G9IPE4_9BACL|nr:biotin transporter BioY [Paenibacillus baekrokdamisoli]MBB3069909.1 biotin transport system substrate-specific component [Paenibacillus baekrokdamisoli]BBH20737.1 biotin transporter BioY [Paenibacillus baekrokdamisoli]
MSIPSQTTTPLSTQTSSVYWIRGIVFTALFSALFIAFSWIKVPLGYTSVPITLQTLAVMLAGGLLGAVYGFWSILIVLLLTATGLPLLHGNGGLPLIFGATGGFIWMFPIAALLIGLVSDKLFRSSKTLNAKSIVILFISIIAFGIVLVYITGVPWLAYKANYTLSAALKGGCYPFLLGDIIKAVVAVVLIRTLRPLLPKFRK